MEKILSFLSSILKIDTAELSKQLETDEGKKEIEGKLKNLNIFSSDDLKTRDIKLKSDHISELADAVGRNEVPTKLYNSIKGNVVSQYDKDLAKKFEVEAFNSHEDLIDKIESKNYDGELDEKLKTDLAEYKSKVIELNGKLEEKDGEFSKFKESEIVNRTKADILNKYPYSAKTDEAKAAQREILSSFLNTKYKFGVDSDKGVLIGEDRNVLKDNSLNAIDPFKKITDDMKIYVEQDNGAAGGNGSGNPKTPAGQKQTIEAFQKEMSEAGKDAEDSSLELRARIEKNLIEM